MNTTHITAVYAAIVATVAFIWNIYKWIRSGPQIYLTASANTQMLKDHGGRLYAYFSTGQKSQRKMYVYLAATNSGGKPTTISNAAFFYYKSWWSRVCRRWRPDESLLIKDPSIGHPIPYLLQPGSVWEGATIQDEKIEKMLKDGVLFFALYLSHKRKPERARVIIRGEAANK